MSTCQQLDRHGGQRPPTIPAADVVPRLLPRLRSRVATENPLLAPDGRAAGGPTHPRRLLGDHLAVGLVYPFPDRLMDVTARQLAGWGLTEDRAFAAAADNLAGLSDAPFRPLSPHVFAAAGRDGHDAARLVLTGAVRGCPVNGDPVAAVADAETLLLTGSRDEAGLEGLVDHLEAVQRPLGGVPLVLRGDRWEVLDLGPDHPLSGRLRAIRLLAEVEDYRRQRDRICERFWAEYDNMPPSFVASAQVGWDRRGMEPFSLCTWQDGLPAILPRAERVAFLRMISDTEPLVLAACGWDRAVAVVGHLMTPVGLYPERFQVRQFPTPDELAKLGVEEWGRPGGCG